MGSSFSGPEGSSKGNAFFCRGDPGSPREARHVEGGLVSPKHRVSKKGKVRGSPHGVCISSLREVLFSLQRQ